MNRRRLGYLTAALLPTGLLLILYSFNPATSGLFPPCPFHRLTGLYCPGCGSLRGVHHLLHGRIAAALSLNPLMVFFIPVLVAMLLKPRWTQRPWVPWAAFAVLVVYGVIRNIPVRPFTLLAP